MVIVFCDEKSWVIITIEIFSYYVEECEKFHFITN